MRPVIPVYRHKSYWICQCSGCVRWPGHFQVKASHLFRQHAALLLTVHLLIKSSLRVFQNCCHDKTFPTWPLILFTTHTHHVASKMHNGTIRHNEGQYVILSLSHCIYECMVKDAAQASLWRLKMVVSAVAMTVRQPAPAKPCRLR